jgi:hypothetical protein
LIDLRVTASHELFEMVIDPIANLWAGATGRTEYAYEMCDPVEEDTFMVDGITMSNFVHPSWFEPFKHPSGTKFDHLGKLKKPFTMTKGGYVIKKQNGRVKETFGSRAKAARFAKENREVIAANSAGLTGFTSSRGSHESRARPEAGRSIGASVPDRWIYRQIS